MTVDESKEPQHRVAVVTGAARGIGLAIGSRLAAEDFSVALWDRDVGQLDEAVQLLRASGANALSVAVDITDSAQVGRALEQSMEALGAPTALVNNAAILGRSGPTLEASLEEWRRVFDVNVFGALQCAQAVVPIMVSHGYGRVVNVASIAREGG